MRIATSLLVVTAALSALSVASPASAQATGTSSSSQRPSSSTAKPSAPLPKPKMNIRAFGAFDVEWMGDAADSFKAVTGSPIMLGYGGGAEVVNLWKRLFVRGDYVTGSSSGERAFVVDGEVVSVGIPVTVRLSTIEIGGGWRIPMRKHPKYTPYVGGALLLTKYSQKSDFEQPTDAVNDSNPGFSVLGGIDAQVGKRLYATFEAQYRSVPNAGVSKLYGDTNLGGFVGRVMFGYNLKK
jgi:hypothetical protein